MGGNNSQSGDSSDMNEELAQGQGQNQGQLHECDHEGSHSDSLKFKVVQQLSCLRQIMARLLREKFQIGKKEKRAQIFSHFTRKSKQ